MPHLLTSVHFLTVPVAVARVGVHADQRTPRVGLVTRGNCQGGEGWLGGGGDSVTMSLFTPFHNHTRNTYTATPKHVIPVMEFRTSLEKDASTELPWRVTGITPPATAPPTLRSSREPWWGGGQGRGLI